MLTARSQHRSLIPGGSSIVAWDASASMRSEVPLTGGHRAGRRSRKLTRWGRSKRTMVSGDKH